MNKKLIKNAICIGLALAVATTTYTLPAKAAPVSGAIAVSHNFEKTELNGSSKIVSGMSYELLKNVSKASTAAVSSDTEILPVPIDKVANAILDVDYEHTAVAQVDGYVNIRSEPNAESEVLGKLYDEGVGTVVEDLGDWVHVQSGSVDGYISADYLSIGDEEVITAAAKCLAKVNADALKVRSEMSTESKVLDVARNGEKLLVADETTTNPEWIKIERDDYEAYVASAYVDVSIDFNYAESKAEEAARLEMESANNGVAVANYALQFVGNPYVWGGTSLTKGADCSGFILSVYKHFGISLPHSSAADRGVGRAVKPSEMRAGDIVCYSGHVGLCIGNGMIVHASSPKSGIKVSSAYYRKILAVRRIF